MPIAKPKGGASVLAAVSIAPIEPTRIALQSRPAKLGSSAIRRARCGHTCSAVQRSRSMTSSSSLPVWAEPISAPPTCIMVSSEVISPPTQNIGDAANSRSPSIYGIDAAQRREERRKLPWL